MITEKKSTILSPPEIYRLIHKYQGTDKLTILDVRDPSKYDEEHILGAENFPCFDNEIEVRLKKLDKDNIYITYCMKGFMSQKLQKLMIKHVFNNVYSIKGGIEAWKDHKLPLTD